MEQWTYNVVVKTEASRNVPQAIRDLATAQTTAANTFESISKFLSQDFQNTILASLDQRMALWELKQQQIDLPNFFQPVYDGLLEVRAALVTMMELKEGGFTNTLNTLRLASDAMAETGATMENAMTKLFTDKYDIGELEAKTIRRARGVHGRIPSSIIDPESETYLSMNEEGSEFQGFADRFLTGAMGNWEEVIKDYPDFLANQVIQEITKFFDNISPRSGKVMVEEILGDDEEGLSALDKLRKLTGAFFLGKKNIIEGLSEGRREEDITTGGQFEEYPKPFSGEQEKELWDTLRNSFKKGVFNMIKEKGNPFLQDETTLGAVDSLLDDVFEKSREILIKRLSEPDRKNIPPVTTAIQSARKDMEIFNIESLSEDIKQYMSQGNDPFGLTPLKEELEQVLLKSKADFETADNDVLLKDIIAKNLGEADLPAIIKESLNIYLVDRMEDISENIFFEMEDTFALIKSEFDKILMIEKIGASLDGVVEMIESFDELPSGTQTEITDPEVNRNVTIDLESVLIDNFKEAKQHTDNWFRDGMVAGINTILAQIEMMRTDMGFNMSKINTSIDNIEIPEGTPATPDQL